jgi:uncharacterized protein YkwD
MKIVKINKTQPDYYKEHNSVSFWNISELSNSVRFQKLNIDLMNAAIFYSTNQERRKNNLPICAFHPKLLDTSMLHSLQMKINSFFSHENQYERKYRTLSDRIESVFSNDFKGFMCAGENISDMKYLTAAKPPAIGLSQPMSYLDISQRIIEGWMNSEGHRLNILNPQFKFLGCGCAPYEFDDKQTHQEGLKITQNFGGDIINNYPKTILKPKFKILK